MARGTAKRSGQGPKRVRLDLSAEMPGLDVPLISDRDISLFCAWSPSGEIAEHRHEQLQLSILFEPAVCAVSWATVDGNRLSHTLTGPAVVMIPPAQAHACHWTNAAEIVVLYLERRLHRTLLPDGAPSVVIAPSILSQDLVLWDCACALRSLCLERRSSETTLVPALAKIVASRATELMREAHIDPERRLAPALIREIEELVQKQLRYEIHAADLARITGYTVPYFSVLFRAAKGVSPAAYIFECRMLKAQRLLRTGNYNIRETAKEVGYLDPGNFTAKFRKRFGVSPRHVIEGARAESSKRPSFSSVRP